MKFEFVLEREDFVQFLVWHQDAQRTKQNILTQYMAPIIILACAASMFYFGNYQTAFIYLAIALFFYFIRSKFFTSRLMKKRWIKFADQNYGNMYNQKVSYEFNHNQILVETNFFKTETKSTHITNIAETKDYCFIAIKGLAVMIFPKSKVNVFELNAVLEKIKI
jgi:hypothetical protein